MDDRPQEKDAIHPQARQWNLENLFRVMEYTPQYIPFHPEPFNTCKRRGFGKKGVAVPPQKIYSTKCLFLMTNSGSKGNAFALKGGSVMKFYKTTMGIMTLGLLLMGWMALPTTSLAASKKYLSLGTGNPGGTYYFIGAGFASLMNKFVPEVRVIAESTAASEENINLVLRKKMDLGMAGIHALPPLIERKADLLNFA